jgi:transcriptional regulator of arginine metabolism
MRKEKAHLMIALKQLLLEATPGTQEAICEALALQGFEVNQTKVSRLLHQVGAMKIKNEHGKVVYCLAKEPPPTGALSSVSSLIIDVTANEMLVVIHTSPGAASLVARLLDYQQGDTEILGSVAGDDTIFVAPKSIAKIAQTLKQVQSLLFAG